MEQDASAERVCETREPNSGPAPAVLPVGLPTVPDDAAPDIGEALLTGYDGYSAVLGARFLYNFYRNTPVHSAGAYRFCFALEKGYTDEIPGFPSVRKKKGDPTYEDKKIDPVNKVTKSEWDNIGAQLLKKMQMPENIKPLVDLQNLRKLAEYLEIDPLSRDVLELIYVADTNMEFRMFFDMLTRGDKDRRGVAIARLLDRPKEHKECARALDLASPLFGYGLLYTDDTDPNVLPEIDGIVQNMAAEESSDPKEIVGKLLGKPTETDLTLKDFAHVGADLDFICKLVRNAVESGAKGINIYIGGPPGGGKTEMAKAIAQSLGYTLFAIGEDGEGYDPDEKVSRVRMGQLKRAQALLKGAKKSLILFDEMEDLLPKGDSSKKAEPENKVELNRLLEDNDVVTLWTGNDTDKFHEAVRQRFAFSVYIDYPPTLVRQKIWRRQCELKQYGLTDEQTLSLARAYAAPPRLIGKAIETAKLVGGGVPEIVRSLEASAKVVYGVREAITVDERVPDGFSARAVNAGGDIEPRTGALVQRALKGDSFALYATGEKGSGVGSYLRFLGERLSMNVVERSMADLCMPTQTATPEMRVNAAFAEAADMRQFLVVSDIEYLKPNPDSQAGWDGSLTDAFIRAAQRHKLPFAATSARERGLPDALDFVFTDTVGMQPFSAEQADAAYRRFFGRAAPEGLDALKGLIPGDFAEVAKLNGRYGADGLENGRIVELLERRLKGRGPGRSGMGFTAAIGRQAP